MRKFSLVILAAMTVMVLPVAASAATWMGTFTFNDDVIYYFDADSVTREGDVTEVWVKVVRTLKPDSDGAWATAYRNRYDCKRRTSQNIAASDYTNNDVFLKSYSNPSAVQLVLPDSLGESMLKTACSANFPKDTSGKLYFKLTDNNVFKARDRYLALVNSSIDNAPK